MDTTFKEYAVTPKLGEVRPIEIFSHERREIDEKTATDLVEVLARDRRFLHPIAVRDEGATGYRLIAGHHRLEAWKRHFGERQPIQAVVFPSHTPDARITVLEAGENLHRKELTAAEREAQTIRLAAALKRLNGWKPATPVSAPGEAAESGKPIPILTPPRRGRGNKGLAQEVAGKLGIGKRAVNMRLDEASEVTGEKIDLVGDTPEELERKADKRQRAEPKIVRLKRRKPAPRVDDPTPAESHAGEIGNKIEAARKAFDALASKDQLRFIHDVCLHVGLDPLKMASPAVFGLTEEESELAVELPAEVALATDGAADLSAEDLPDAGAAAFQAAEQEAEVAVSLPAEPAPATNDIAVADPEHPVDAVDLGAEDLQDAEDDVSAAADQEPAGANLHAEHLHHTGADGSVAADREPCGAPKCAYCTMEFYSSDERVMIHGRLYHADLCAKSAKPPIAIAA
jgi:ParB-like nuclease domain